MGFIPDSYSATVRIGARWRNGKLLSLGEEPIPEIQDGTLIELVIPAWAVTSENDRRRLRSMTQIDMLPEKEILWLGLSRQAVSPELHEKFPNHGAGAAAGYLLADVKLLAPLRASMDGSQRIKLEPCRCHIRLMNTEARSLNHAYTLLSQEFEPERLSHTGNVFRHGFVKRNGHWASLNDLRLVRVLKALEGPDPK
jgi:hypothetical protein